MQQDKLRLLIIVGTSRNGATQKISSYVYDICKNEETFEIKIVTPSDFTLPLDGNDNSSKDAKYTEITSWADAFLIITPEYNHGYPGSLKRLLDSEYDNYKNKPAMIFSVSDGAFGGSRVVEQLLPVLHEIGMVVLREKVYFFNVNDVIENIENFVENDYQKRIKKVLPKLEKWGRVLKENKDTLA